RSFAVRGSFRNLFHSVGPTSEWSRRARRFCAIMSPRRAAHSARWADKRAGGSIFGRPSGSVFGGARRRKRVALVVLLRGVNVGGHRTFRPTTLAEQLKHLDAVNIGAAGTFVIRQPVTRAQLRAEFARRLPFDTEIMICQGREIVRLMSQNH